MAGARIEGNRAHGRIEMEEKTVKFGGIEFGGKLGGYELINQSTEKLPQDLASAVGKVFKENNILGVTYEPIWYLGTQIVNGTNSLFICSQTRLTKDREKKIVGVVINIPAGSIGGNDAKIIEVIEDSDLTPVRENSPTSLGGGMNRAFSS